MVEPDEPIAASKQPPWCELAGLALSGGGIRSASFCLGVMQALASRDKLKWFDYLSAVSGGSWIAASVSWFLSRSGIRDDATGEVLRYGLGSDDFCYNTKSKFFSPETKKWDEPTRQRLRGRNLTSWLRGRGKIITPGFGLGLSALISTVLRSVVINLLIALPIILAAFVGLRQLFDKTVASQFWTCRVTDLFCEEAAYIQLYLWSICIFAAVTVLYAVFSRILAWFLTKKPFKQAQDEGEEKLFRSRAFFTKWMGRLMSLIFCLTVLVSLPLLNRLLAKISPGITHKEWISGLASVLGGVAAWVFGTGGGNNTKSKATLWLGKIIVPLGSAILVYGGLFALYVLSARMAPDGRWSDSLTYMLVLAGVLALIPNINDNSLHRFYRDRLMTAFLPDPILQAQSPSFSDRFRLSQLQPIPDSNGSTRKKLEQGRSSPVEQVRTMWREFWKKRVYYVEHVIEAERKYLKARRVAITQAEDKGKAGVTPAESIGNRAAPYLLINATLTTTDSPDRKLRGRGFAHFLLSSNFVGSDVTGYQDTKKFLSDRFTLASAMAISGAAVDPNTYVTRNRALSLIMALLNIRTGFWAPNVRPDCRPTMKRTAPFWVSAIGSEMIGRQLNEKKRFIHLSDGGHAENLGIYELIRRRCKVIVAVDAGADPEWTWQDFGRVVEQVRVDFGVEIKVRDSEKAFREIRPSEGRGAPYKVSKRCCLVADIEYPAARPQGSEANLASAKHAPQTPEQSMEKDTHSGILVLIKTTMPENVRNADLHAYKLANPRFPDEFTLDQFFDETQFEAYRQLGFEIAERVMQDSLIDCNVGWLYSSR